ncbi:response regulator [Piscinibacter koreensis]|uniref:Response regulator transcription factor n=1 Tax=Piscinibacter koreensis TaxID=2742824 RepID=A0A7Y6NJV6_9BURK|nr:response regulator transcription factor [Schlegelella koreensis]NUZ04516.1 response regulator transcription factor [Schlegelella koreensis]
MRILVVEDDVVLQGVMQRSLAEAGHRVDAVSRAEEANHLWRVQPYDTVLLDLNLPDGNGVDVLREARARGDRTPVLVLTSRNRTDERIAGLDAGADDYLGKPFDLGEVEARLRALVRRRHDTGDRCEVGALVLDRRAGRFFRVSGETREPFELPAREQAVLTELMTPPGRVVNKRMLSDKLSDFEDALGDNALEAFISRLRKKLAGTGASIRTLRGLGYLIEASSEDAA